MLLFYWNWVNNTKTWKEYSKSDFTIRKIPPSKNSITSSFEATANIPHQQKVLLKSHGDDVRSFPFFWPRPPKKNGPFWPNYNISPNQRFFRYFPSKKLYTNLGGWTSGRVLNVANFFKSLPSSTSSWRPKRAPQMHGINATWKPDNGALTTRLTHQWSG